MDEIFSYRESKELLGPYEILNEDGEYFTYNEVVEDYEDYPEEKVEEEDNLVGCLTGNSSSTMATYYLNDSILQHNGAKKLYRDNVEVISYITPEISERFVFFRDDSDISVNKSDLLLTQCKQYLKLQGEKMKFTEESNLHEIARHQCDYRDDSDMVRTMKSITDPYDFDVACLALTAGLLVISLNKNKRFGTHIITCTDEIDHLIPVGVLFKNDRVRLFRWNPEPSPL